MINFNTGKEVLNKYLGSESKITVVFDDATYMVKFPDPIISRSSKDILGYKYNQFSEHIGSNIFRACGFEAQETKLGYYTDSHGNESIVVGCQDFTQGGNTLYEFAKIANSVTTSLDKHISSIENVMFIINESKFITDKLSISNRFWDMFVIDALIGNDDRHFNNWGLLGKGDGSVVFAPIYDCGASLSAMLDDSKMNELLSSPDDFNMSELHLRSSYSIGGKRVRYFDIFNAPPEELEKAIKRTIPKIDMVKINGIIDSVTLLSDIRKEYLKQALYLRCKQILFPAFERIVD